jgi:hypothetical protein
VRFLTAGPASTLYPGTAARPALRSGGSPGGPASARMCIPDICSDDAGSRTAAAVLTDRTLIEARCIKNKIAPVNTAMYFAPASSPICTSKSLRVWGRFSGGNPVWKWRALDVKLLVTFLVVCLFFWLLHCLSFRRCDRYRRSRAHAHVACQRSSALHPSIQPPGQACSSTRAHRISRQTRGFSFSQDTFMVKAGVLTLALMASQLQQVS